MRRYSIQIAIKGGRIKEYGIEKWEEWFNCIGGEGLKWIKLF